MNATTTTKPGAKIDDKKETCGTATDKSEVCATTAAMPECCATTAGKSEACANTHDGKVVSISGSKLVMSGQDGKEHSHTVAADAKVCCDGTACKAQDLKVGSKIRVTTQTDDKNVATQIESLDKQTKFAQSV